MVNVIDVLTKFTGSYFVASNRYSAWCPSTNVSFWVCWLGSQFLKCNRNYYQRSIVDILALLENSVANLAFGAVALGTSWGTKCVEKIQDKRNNNEYGVLQLQMVQKL